MKKIVDENGTVLLKDDEVTVVSFETTFNSDDGSLELTIDGNLRTDTQVYLASELGFYSVAPGVKKLEVDCGKLTAISPGCFKELLDVSIKFTAQGKIINFINKSNCVLSKEKLMGKKL